MSSGREVARGAGSQPLSETGSEYRQFKHEAAQYAAVSAYPTPLTLIPETVLVRDGNRWGVWL